jgi:hypothetical protein
VIVTAPVVVLLQSAVAEAADGVAEKVSVRQTVVVKAVFVVALL